VSRLHALPVSAGLHARRLSARRPSEPRRRRTQAGGFGGGNVGGGGFADPICLTFFGLNHGCTGAPFSQSLTKTGGRGGAVVQWTTPVTPWIVVGVLGDLSFGNNSVTQTQNNFYSDPTSFGFVTTETLQNTVTERTSGSVRFKAGFVVPLGYTSIMPYTTVGWTRAQIQGSFTYAASNYSPSDGCSAFASCSAIAASTVNYTANRNGVVWGFGVEMPLPAFGPGVVLVLDYSRSQFGSFDVSLPAVVTSVEGSSCSSSGISPCSIVDIGHFSNVSFSTFSVGARFKFF
jgi:opacity protein-like surface antigen